MDCSYIAEHHVADRYVLHQLSNDEAELFEDHYMLCDVCLGTLERSQLMARGMKRVGAEEAAKIAVVAAASASWWSRQRTWLAAAAAVAIGAVLALTLLDPGASSREAASPVSVIYLQTQRSGPETGPSRQIELADAAPSLVLVLEIDPPFYPSYYAMLERAGGELWQSAPLNLGERDTITIGLDKRQLTPGDHLLRLEALTSQGQRVGAGRFSFRVLR